MLYLSLNTLGEYGMPNVGFHICGIRMRFHPLQPTSLFLIFLMRHFMLDQDPILIKRLTAELQKLKKIKTKHPG